MTIPYVLRLPKPFTRPCEIVLKTEIPRYFRRATTAAAHGMLRRLVYRFFYPRAGYTELGGPTVLVIQDMIIARPCGLIT